MIFKIQSISDVITNSSTEVYITYYPSDKDAIINVVNAILAINGGGKFEDYFEFKWYPNEDFLYDKWEEDGIKIPFEQWVESLPESYYFQIMKDGMIVVILLTVIQLLQRIRKTQKLLTC